MTKRNKWRTKEALKIAEEAGLKALRTGAESILTEAINEAPIESGTLRRSGTVTVGGLPDGTQVYESAKAGADTRDAFSGKLGKEKAVYISFNTPYARRQHEEVGYSHPVGGGPKYLENPFRRNAKKVLRMVELRVKRDLQKES
jgi:hypothetical protein